MRKSRSLLDKGFVSSSSVTPEFQDFFNIFKTEFKKELETIGATNIVFNKGHFFISGFFTVDNQAYYFNLPDVRNFSYAKDIDPNSCMCKLMYRTAKDYKDFTGGTNRYVSIKPLMADEMCWYFKTV